MSVNIIPLDSIVTTRSMVFSDVGGTLTEYGSDAEAYDNDLGTYRGGWAHHSSDGDGHLVLTSTNEWDVELHISSIRAKGYTYPDPNGNYKDYDSYFKIELKIDGVWTTIYSDIRSSSGAVTYDETISTGWDKVTGMRVTGYARGYSYEGTRSQDAYVYIYESQAFATFGNFAQVI